MASAGGHWSKEKYQPAKQQATVSPTAVQAANTARPASPPDKPPVTAQYLRENSKQTGMFSQGEDTPLFSGTAQRATVDPYKKKVQGKQDRFDGGPKAVRENPLARKQEENPRERYTDEYHEAKKQREHLEKNPNEAWPGELEDAKSEEKAQQDLSAAARDAGYTPGKMTKEDWADFAESEKYGAKQDLKKADPDYHKDAGRAAVGRKVRGIGDDRQFVEVGGKTYERTWKGGSEASANKAAASIKRNNQVESDQYLGKKLTGWGFKNTDDLSYSDKKRLVREVADNKTSSGKIGGMDQKERREIISTVPKGEKEKAEMIDANPAAAKGVDKWSTYEMAAIKAGDKPEKIPYQYFT